MAQHYTKATVEASEWCNVCRKHTPHLVFDGPSRRVHGMYCAARSGEGRARGCTASGGAGEVVLKGE
jgi:hypothetical protein